MTYSRFFSPTVVRRGDDKLRLNRVERGNAVEFIKRNARGPARGVKKNVRPSGFPMTMAKSGSTRGRGEGVKRGGGSDNL